MSSAGNTYIGVTAINAGVVNIQDADALGTFAGNTTVASDAALEIQGTFTTAAEALTLNGTGIANGGALRNISGSSTYAGAITLNSATRINSDSGTLTLNVASGNAITGTNQNVTFGGAGNVTVSDSISIGSGALTKDGTGTLVLSVANSYTGGTTIHDGVLQFSVAGAIGGTGANVTLNSGGTAAAGYAIDQTFLGRIVGSSAGVVALGANSGSTLNFNTAGLTAARLGATGTFTYSGTLTPNGTTYRVGGGGGTLTISSALTGAGNSLDMGLGGTSSGDVILTGANTYTGTTLINQGNLTLGYNSGGRIADTSGITFAGSGIFTADFAGVGADRVEDVGALTFTAGEATVESVRTGRNVDLAFSSLATRASGAVGNFVLTGGSATQNQINLTGQATGFINQGLFFNGADYAYMNGAGTYVRAINYVTPDSGATTQAGGTTIATTAHAQTTGAVTAQATATFTTLKIVNSANSAQAFTLASGATVTTNGILRAGNGGTSSTTTISGGTAIKAASGAELVIRTDLANDLLVINTPILANGSNALTKSGAGTLTLGATNTYTGITTVNAGTLVVNGSTAGSAMTVASIAKLFGTGTIGGATTILGTQSSGASSGAVGTQNFSSSLSYSSGSIFEWDINVTGSNAETHDNVVAGSLLGSGAVFKIGLVGSGDTFASTFWNTTRNWTATDLFGVNTNLATIFSSATTTTNFNPSPLEGSFSFTDVSPTSAVRL